MAEQWLIRQVDPATGQWKYGVDPAASGGGGSLPFTGWTGDESDPQAINANGGILTVGQVTAGDVSDDGLELSSGPYFTAYESGDVVALLEDDGGNARLTIGREGGDRIFISADAVSGPEGGTIQGFDNFVPTNAPQVPATPLPQDIVDALVTLGLITQASP